MNKIAAVVFSLLVTAVSFASDIGGFKSARWGQSVAEVKKMFPAYLEKKGDNGSVNLYGSKDTFGGHEAEIQLLFNNGKLANVFILVTEKLENESVSTVVCGDLKNQISMKYGKPASQSGSFIINTVWSTSDTAVELSCADGMISTTIKSKEFNESEPDL